MRLALFLYYLTTISHSAYADKTYDLDLIQKHTSVRLFVNDDQTFDIMLSVYETEHQVMDVCVAHGNYKSAKDRLILYDSLWGTKTVLQRNGRNYKAIAGLQLFTGRNFVFDHEYPPSNDTNSFMSYAIRAQKRQRVKNDSLLTIINNKVQEPKSFRFQPNIYRTSFNWFIRFTKKNQFTYIIDRIVIAKGTWKQKGNHIILHCIGSNQDYVAEMTAPNKINAIYFPLIDDGEAVFFIWAWDQ